MVYLGNAEKFPDALQPVSTATQAALDLKASSATVTVALATKADQLTAHTETDVDGKFTSLLNGAPDALRALNELSAALGADPDFNDLDTSQPQAEQIHHERRTSN